MTEKWRPVALAFAIAAFSGVIWLSGGGPGAEPGELSQLGEIGGLGMLAGAVIGLVLALRTLLPNRD